MRAWRVADVRRAEAQVIAELPDGALMQRAAAGLATAIIDFLGGAYAARIRLLVGTGDNGGDALYAGARLARRGAVVEAVLLGDAHAEGLAHFVAAGGRIVDADDPRRADLVVDGIVGIGGRPGLRELAITALAAQAGAPIVAVDLPSGLDADTGASHGLPHVMADLTVTFGCLKGVHLMGAGAHACGAIELVDIGLGPILANTPPLLEALHPDDVAPLLPDLTWDDHKYTRGVVGLDTGSARYPGAGLLSVAGAASGLAGMVRYAGDPGVAATLTRLHPEVVTGPGRVQAWVVGSGSDDRAGAALAAVIADEVPVVIDADALDHLTAPTTPLGVLTPHAGELARIMGVDRGDVEAEPLVWAQRAAEHFGCVVVLKVPRTVVAAPGRTPRINLTDHPWLGTAGSGDVLGGVIGALLATGLEPMDAAAVGLWLHGAAGRFAGPACTASQIADQLSRAARLAMAGHRGQSDA